MDYGRRIFFSIAYVIVGVVVFVLSANGTIDGFWAGFGGALIAVGGLQLIRHARYRTNEEYRESWDTAQSDERNRFLSNKAHAWAGYIFVITAAVSVLVFKFMGHEDWMMLASGALCLYLIIYWVSYMVLRNKY